MDVVQPHAFISYVRENKDIVDRLAKDLQANGIVVWLDINDIVAGEWWKDVIDRAINKGAFFIACFSKEFYQRRETHMHGEIRIAIDRLKNMPKERLWFIPVLLNETQLPSHNISGHETLADINAVTLYEEWDNGVRKLLQAMRLEDPNVRRTLHLINLIKFHPAERGHAMEQLGQIARLPDAAGDVIPALAEALRDEAIDVRESACNLLGQIGPAALPPLCQALRDPDGDLRVREHAADALARIGSAAVPALCDALRDADSDICERAADALRKIGPATPGAIPGLCEAHRHSDAYVRERVADTLRMAGPAAAEGMPALCDALRDQNWHVRKLAADVLAGVGARAVPALTEAICDPDRYVRRIAADALGWIGPAAADAVPALKGLLSDEDKTVRERVVDALGRIGPSGATGVIWALAEALSDDDWYVRRCAADAIGRIGPSAGETAPALCEALSDENRDVRESVAVALGRIGPVKTDAVPALREALRDPDAYVRQRAADALHRISPDLHAGMIATELSAHTAATEAGFRTRTLTVPDDVDAAVETLVLRFGERALTHALQRRRIAPSADVTVDS